MQRQGRATPASSPDQGRPATVEELQAFINLQTKEKFERNAIMIDEKTQFSLLAKKIIEMPLLRNSRAQSGGSTVSSAESSSKPPIYAPPPSNAYPTQPRRNDNAARFELKNPTELVQRDQMAWETYEVRSRQLRRIKQDGTEGLLPRPVTQPALQQKGDKTPRSDSGHEVEEDALLAARNLRLMHARRRRGEGSSSASEQATPPPISTPPSSSVSSLPPLRASTPSQQQRRSSSGSLNEMPLPQLASAGDGGAGKMIDLAIAMQKDESFMRSTTGLEEQAARTQIEKKFKLHAKVASLKTQDRERSPPNTAPPPPLVKVPSASRAQPPPAAVSTPPRPQQPSSVRPEFQKQATSIQKEEMAARLHLTESEASTRKSIVKNCQETAAVIKERSHRVQAHTEVKTTTSAEEVHVKANALVEARRASHKRAIDTACQLLIDEEDLERDDIVGEWEESCQHHLFGPFLAKLQSNLSVAEAKARGELERTQEKVFRTDCTALKRYLHLVEPLVEAHRLDCDEIFRQSYSAIELMTSGMKEVASLMSAETTARWQLHTAQDAVWVTILSNDRRGAHLTNQALSLFTIFSSSKALLSCVETEVLERNLVEIAASQHLVEILDKQQTDVEGNSKFKDWNALAVQLFQIELNRKQLLFDIIAHSIKEATIISKETAHRLLVVQAEAAVRSLLVNTSHLLASHLEALDDHNAISKRELMNSKHELLHRSNEFKTLPIEIQEAAQRVRDRDSTFDTFIAPDCAAYTPNDFAKLCDILKQSAAPHYKKISVRCGSSHALSLYECNPVELELNECGLEDIDASSLGFLEYLSSPSCRLESLNLDGNDLTDVTVRKYLRVLKYKNHKLRHVSIRENVDVPENLQHALSYLAELNSYTESFKHLMVRAQENDASLKSIDMSHFIAQQSLTDSTGKLYPKGDACVRLLCLSLQNNTHCTNVNLANFGVQENGARNLATLLRTNRAIAHLDLSNNLIGMAGVSQVAQAASSAAQKPTVVFFNNFTLAEVDKEEANARRTLTKFEEFQYGFVLAFIELSEGRVLRLSQVYEKKQQTLAKYEAPYVRQKLLEEHHLKERVELCEDECVVRGLVHDRYDDALAKLKLYTHQRLKDAERLSRDRSSMLLYHTILLEMEMDRAAKVTLLEKFMRKQTLLDCEFWFRHLKFVEEQHEGMIALLQHHHMECMEYYLASEGEVRKIAEVLFRQPQAIREVVFAEKLKMMQRLDSSPTPRVATSPASAGVSILPNVVALPVTGHVAIPQATAVHQTHVRPPPPPVMTVAPVTPTPPRAVQVATSPPPPLLAPVSPSQGTSALNSILRISNSQQPAASLSSPQGARAVSSSPPQPARTAAPVLTTATTVSLNVSPPRRAPADTPQRPRMSIDSLITSRNDFRPHASDDFPVTDESIVLMHDIVCNGGAPVDRVNLSYRCERVNFATMMPLIEDMSHFIEVLDISGCGIGDAHVPALVRIITAAESQLRCLGVKDNAFSLEGLTQLVESLKRCQKNLVEVHLGQDDEAVQLTSQVRRLRDQVRFYLALKGPRGGRFKKLLLDVEADESFVKVLDFSHTIMTHRRQREFARKKMRKTGHRADDTPSRGPTSRSSILSSSTEGALDHSNDSDFVVDRSSDGDVPRVVVDTLDEGILSENAMDIPPPLDDDAVQLICFAMSTNHHVYHISLRGNNIGEEGGRRLLKYLKEYGDVTPLQWIDIRDNLIPDVVGEEIMEFFVQLWSRRLNSEVIAVEAAARTRMLKEAQYDTVFVPLCTVFLATMRLFASVEERWMRAHSDVYDFFVAQGRIDIVVIDPETEQRKIREQIVAQFYEKARIYLMLLNYRSEKYLKYCAQKSQLLQEEEVTTNKVGKLILALDPALQAVAVHIARNNMYVDMLDLSSTPLEPRCSDEIIAVMTGLMKQNTYVKEVSLANSGGYFNPHRSMPLIAEMGTRLEALDLTNCHIADAHVGAITAMLQNPDCTLETLILDENYLSSVGARKLAKAIRASKTLSCVSLSRNSNMSLEDQKLLQFYCDLNKYTEAFKQTILRVEANDPSLTELHFDRKGNLDERSVFDDVSMRLLCAALPHNTHVERIFLMGNHVSDDGALCLLNLLKSKVNRSVYVVDLSGNDVSPALVDELSKLVLIRLKETIEHTVFDPEDIARTIIAAEDRSFWFWMEHLKKASWAWDTEVRAYEDEKLDTIGKLFHNAELDFHVLQHERQWRQLITDEEKMFASVSEYVHESVVRGYHPIVLDYMRAMRRMYMTAHQEIEDLLEELDRQPNIELRKNALWILNNMRRIESLDLSSTLPSDFCEQEILCNGRTVDIALRMLSKNKSVKKLTLANNAGRVPGWDNIWPLSRRLESLDVSRCALTDSEVPQICQMISDPQSTLKELILDGNLFSEVGCMDIMRTLRYNAENRADFPLQRLSVADCPHVSEDLISVVEFISELLRCSAPFRELMLRLRFGSDEVITVDAQNMEITDDLCKLLCMALKPHKKVKAIKLRRNKITDIGVDYLCRLVKSIITIEHVDVTDNDVSSIARRQLASLLEDRLGKRLGNDVEMPEDFHREDIVYEESMFPRFFWHYNKLTPNVVRHYERAVDIFVNYAGKIWGIARVFTPEQDARKGVVEVLELQQRMMLYKWMQYHQWIVNFGERTNKQKAQWVAEGSAAVRELAQLVAAHPSRELREKAFKLALNSPNVVFLSLVQQCDENAVVILGKVLKGNQHCKEINLSGNHQIKPAWVLPLISEATSEVEILNLSDCNLRDGDIADPLRNYLAVPKCKLSKVILDRNFLTQGTMQRVVPVLRESNHLLLELSVKHNPELSRVPLHYLDFCLELNKYIGIGHEHGKREDYIRIKSLLVAVEANRPDITTLNFVNDEYALLMLDDQFAKLVCIALAYNTHVRTLYIRGHQITDRGAQYILQVLQGANRTLDFVDLHGNFVSDSMLLAIEYCIPWRIYAADLDKLLEAAVTAFQNVYNSYEANFFSSKREHQLYIIRPCFDSRTDIEKAEDLVFRKLLSRYPEWLRFADAWHKSYKYAFQRTFLQAEETLPIDTSTIDPRLSKSIVDAFSPKKAASTNRLLDATNALKAQLLPDFLRQKYLKFVSLTDLYEQKCVSALEKVFASCSPVGASATEAFLANAYSAARIPSIYVPPDKAQSDSKLGNAAMSFLNRLTSPTSSQRRAQSPAVSFKGPVALDSPLPETSFNFGSRAQSIYVSNDRPRSTSPATSSGGIVTPTPLALSPPPMLGALASDGRVGSPPREMLRMPSFGNFGESFVAPSKDLRRSSSGGGSGFFQSSQFAEISGIDEEKLLLKLVARYERLHEQVLAYEAKCAQMIQSQFRLAANDLAFVGRNRRIHGPQCDDRCVCAISETSVDAARKLHDRLAQRFTKYTSQVANFEDVCVSTLSAAFDESRLALIELRNLYARKSQAEIDALRLLNAKLQNRFERYVATVDDFEKKCVAALQKAFDIHAAPVERQIEDSLMKKQLVDEKLAEAAELHHKLHQRYIRYESVMADFETKCRGAKERLVKPDLDLMMQQVRRDSISSRERRSVVFLENDPGSPGAGGLPTVKSFFSSPARTNPAVIKLQARFEKYKQQVDEFELQCAAAYEAQFLREKSKLETGSSQSFRRSPSFSTRESAAAAGALNRAPSLRRVDSMASIVSPDAKTEQALQLLPTQPQALQRAGRLIANNDPTVVSLDLSSTSDPKPVNDTTIGILFTLLRSNNQLRELNLSNQGHHLTITSMKLVSRLGRKLEKFDLSNGMMENQLLAPTVCAMLSVPECSLMHLNLNNNKLNQEGILQIMQVLRKTNNSLTTISLTGNEGVDKSSISFINFYCDLNKFVPVDAKFKPLVLSAEKNDENTSQILLKNVGYVDDLALRCLCVALARNSNVTVVNLAGNAISDKSVKHLVQLISLNSTITRLDLSANRFTQEGITALRRAASDSKSLSHFIV